MERSDGWIPASMKEKSKPRVFEDAAQNIQNAGKNTRPFTD
ncbi:MAG TPA: hypothetical protein VG895_05480 [Patescibacteria group bacterium]|nr:hypothetical protein [Patescibacteria group bacterium]